MPSSSRKQPRSDREVVLAAVKQEGSALMHAAEPLKDDREVVLAAVKQNGWGAPVRGGAVEGGR